MPDFSTRPADDAWYVIHTKPHKESLVGRKLAARGILVFEPRIVALVRAGRHVQRRVVPMFPRYVFARLAILSQAISVRYEVGVQDFLRSNGAPQALAESVVDLLRERTGPQGVFDPPPPHFAPGDRVRIEDGPFRGLEAVFERELSGAERVAVLLESMQLAPRVVLAGRDLVAA